MKYSKLLLTLLSITLASCGGGGTDSSSSQAPSSSDSPSSEPSSSIPASSDPSSSEPSSSEPSSSEPSSSEESSEPSSSSSEASIPAEIADIASLGKHLYKESSKAINAYSYRDNDGQSRYSFSTREMLISRGENSFTYEGLIGGYYREISTGSSSSATKVNETSQTGSTAYWQEWIDSKLEWNSLANHGDNTHFGVNGVTRPFGKYDETTGALTGVSTPKVYRVGAVSSGYRVYIESYLETSNTELSLWYNYEITCDVYFTSDLVLTSISTSYDRASNSAWDSETHSISGTTSFAKLSYSISDISWGEIPAYNDEKPLVDFAPYYMSSLIDIDIVDEEAGWHGTNGIPRQGDYYSMPNLASKMSFLPATALDFAEVDITSVSPAGALLVGTGYGQFLYDGEIQITFGTVTNPNLLTKTYNVETYSRFELTTAAISSFEGNLEADTTKTNTYSSSITVGGTAYYTGITGQGTAVNLDLREITCTYDNTLISVSYEASSNLDGMNVLFSVTGLKAGTGTLTITTPDSTAEDAGTITHTINITVTA